MNRYQILYQPWSEVHVVHSGLYTYQADNHKMFQAYGLQAGQFFKVTCLLFCKICSQRRYVWEGVVDPVWFTLGPKWYGLVGWKLFCSLALAFILKWKLNLEPDTIFLSLKRVHVVMELNPLLQEDTMILSQIVKCRQLAVHSGCINIWTLFLPYLVK